jgi:hypothetical protein
VLPTISYSVAVTMPVKLAPPNTLPTILLINWTFCNSASLSLFLYVLFIRIKKED